MDSSSQLCKVQKASETCNVNKPMQPPHTQQQTCVMTMNDQTDQKQQILEPRLAELILISSMYPKQLRCLDSLVQTAVDEQNYSINYPQTITALFTIDQYVQVNILMPNVEQESDDNDNKLQVHCRIVDSSLLNRTRLQEQLNDKLKEDNTNNGNVGLIDIIPKIIQIWNELNEENPLPIFDDLSLAERHNHHNSNKDANIHQEKLCRNWIYSHHIKSSVKRKSIIDLCKKSNLNGFMLIGKPGFICVEGTQSDCEDFWCTIRAWQWQRLTMIDDESLDDNPDSMIFRTFQEYSDRSTVFRILEAKNCDKIIKKFIGIN